MAELTFKSAGVATREIDLSGPTTVKPQGTPAGVIGMSLKGRAFVPITFATYQDFVAEFGTSDGEKFGPLAVYEWMKNSRAGTYVRTLGVGDGNRRTTSSPNAGRVTNAGFSVGAEQPQSNGLLGENAFAGPSAGIPAEQATAIIEIAGGAGAIAGTLTSIELLDIDNDPITITISATGQNTAGADTVDLNDGSGNAAELELAIGNDFIAGYASIANAETALQNQTLTIHDKDGDTDYHFVIDPLQNVNQSNSTTIGIQDLADTQANPHAFGAQAGFAGDSVANALDFDAALNKAPVHNFMAAVLTALGNTDYVLGTPVWSPNITHAATCTVTADSVGAYSDPDDQEIAGGLVTDPTHGSPAAADRGIRFLNSLGTNENEFDNGVDARTTAEELQDDLVALINDASSTGTQGGSATMTALAVLNNGNPSVQLTQAGAAPAGVVLGNTAITEGGAGDANIIVDAEFAGGIAAIGQVAPALGRTYFLGCLTEETATSNLFSDAGISVDGTIISDEQAAPILRGVILAPSGVLLSLSSSYYQGGDNTPDNGNNAPSSEARGQFGTNTATDDGGYMWGTVNRANAGQQFVMLLNGHVNTPAHPNILTASLDPVAPDYFRNIFNTDPSCTEKAGHCLYTSWDVHTNHGVAGGTGIIDVDYLSGGNYGNLTAASMTDMVEAAFLVTGSLARDDGTSIIPNPECFEDRYRTAKSPWVTSQKFGGKVKNLFKIHALDDGTAGSNGFKISISSIAASSNESTDFGTFDLFVRAMEDDDDNIVALEKFYKLSIDPTSERYIARVIGDQYTYYDFDKPEGSQKLVIDGIHPNRSKYIRVEMAGEVDRNTIDDSALPVGFRGHNHLVTSGTVDATSAGASSAGSPGFLADSLLSSSPMGLDQTDDSEVLFTTDPLSEIVQIPVPMRQDITTGQDPRRKASSNLHWGVQFQVNDDPVEPNKSRVFDKSIYGLTKYFPDFHDGWLNLSVGDNAGTPDDTLDGLVSVLDSDRFNRNAFSLENVEVQGIDLESGLLDNKKWNEAVYRRDAEATGATSWDTHTPRLLGGAHFQEDFSSIAARKYRKFSFFLQGGFDGLNILDKNKAKMTDLACRREMLDSQQQGGVDGPTVASYRKALDVMAEKADVDIKLLAIPGLRDASVTEYAIDTCEDRFDAMLIMDVIERDDVNDLVENKADQVISVSNTVEDLLGRNLDTSFAAAYFPDVVVPDPATRTNVLCPPSVAVLGAFALNDAVAHPWFAPAGFTRGALARVVESQVKLNRANLDALYEADINPLSAFPHTPGVVVWGQKTLQAAKSALDRVNVRRLLIEIRRQVKRVGNTLLFEPNRAETLARFSNAVNPILQRIQQQQGLDKFKVVIDTTTTTQADVENNTVRGKIFLQPTRTVEFISLDFVVTNAGMEV